MAEKTVGVKIGYDKINVEKTSYKNFSSIKTKKKPGKNGKNYQSSSDQFDEPNELDHPLNSAWPSPSWIEH